MTLAVRDAELFGVTETSATVSFVVADGDTPVDAAARIVIDGEVRAVSEGPAGTRQVRVEGLAAGSEHALEIEVPGGDAAVHGEWLPERFETLPAPGGTLVASFATLNDLHFGEPRFGGTLLENGDYGNVAPGYPAILEGDTDVPYWHFMNEDAISEINAEGVDCAVIKGDIADRGLPHQFDAARKAFGRFEMPHHAFLGNHDYYALEQDLEVDGYGLLGQPAAPRALDLGGWRLLLVETVLPGDHHGVLPAERLQWISDALDETRGNETPTLLAMHHQPVPPEHADSYPNTIGIVPEHSLALFDLVSRHAQLRGVLIGHTHRNRVRRYRQSGAVPFIEVACTKDYPGGWGHYRLFDDGSFRQEVRRTASERALAHSTLCRDCFDGGYRRFALGPLSSRSAVF